jgi:hypothetical protein
MMSPAQTTVGDSDAAVAGGASLPLTASSDLIKCPMCENMVSFACDFAGVNHGDEAGGWATPPNALGAKPQEGTGTT